VSFVSRMPCKAAKMISGEYFNVPGMQQDRYISKLASFRAIALMLFSIFALCAQNLKNHEGLTCASMRSCTLPLLDSVKRGSADVRICRLGLGLVCHIRTLQIRTFAFDPLLHVVVVIFLSGVRRARF